MGAKPASASVVLLLGVTPDPFLWVQGKKANGLSSALSIVSSKKKKKGKLLHVFGGPEQALGRN